MGIGQVVLAVVLAVVGGFLVRAVAAALIPRPWRDGARPGSVTGSTPRSGGAVHIERAKLVQLLRTEGDNDTADKVSRAAARARSTPTGTATRWRPWGWTAPS